ncbi:MAG: hypothetical protein LQ352_001907 [Teloschistes flavicans]|nr:MAG: hypothetical protein LQ352_001907 [Teloschistes flavicans]
MDEDEEWMPALKSRLVQFEAQARKLQFRQQSLAETVENQTRCAHNDIAKDQDVLKRQLQVACGSVNHTIEAVVSNRRWLPWLYDETALTTQNDISAICQDLITAFDRLANTAADANRRLNAIHRNALQTEDQLTELAPELETCETEIGRVLEVVEELLGTAQEATQELVEARQEAEKELEVRRGLERGSQQLKRHRQKQARWLWAGALVTGGLIAPFAMAASSSKRNYRNFRDSMADQAANIEKGLEEQQEIEAALAKDVDKIETANTKLEATKGSLAVVIKKNDILTTVVKTQLDQYLNLREQAMMVASRARELHGRVDTLTYAEGANEVKRVMAGLVDDMQGKEIKALMSEAGFNFEGATRKLL